MNNVVVLEEFFESALHILQCQLSIYQEHLSFTFTIEPLEMNQHWLSFIVECYKSFHNDVLCVVQSTTCFSSVQQALLHDFVSHLDISNCPLSFPKHQCFTDFWENHPPSLSFLFQSKESYFLSLKLQFCLEPSALLSSSQLSLEPIQFLILGIPSRCLQLTSEEDCTSSEGDHNVYLCLSQALPRRTQLVAQPLCTIQVIFNRRLDCFNINDPLILLILYLINLLITFSKPKKQDSIDLTQIQIQKKQHYQYLYTNNMTQGLYFTRPNDPSYLQVLVAINFLGLKLNTQQINKKYDPLVLLTPHGALNQPNTILQYLARQKLAGHSEQQKIRVCEWFEFFNLELHPLLKELYDQISKDRPSNKQKYQYSLKELLRVLDILNNHLKIRTFFVGDALSVIDIHLATHLQTAFKIIISEDLRKKIPNLSRWFSFVRSTGPFLSVLGPLNLCGKNVFEVKQQAVRTN